MKMDTNLQKYLGKHKINFIKYEHPAIFTVDESRDLKKSIPGLHCKCLFLKDSDGNFYLIGMPAEKKLDIKKLQLHFNQKNDARFLDASKLPKRAICCTEIFLIEEISCVRSVPQPKGCGFSQTLRHVK